MSLSVLKLPPQGRLLGRSGRKIKRKLYIRQHRNPLEFTTMLHTLPCHQVSTKLLNTPDHQSSSCHSFELHTQDWGQPGFHFKHFSRSALILSPIWPQHRPESELIFELWQALACRFFCTRVRSLPDLVCKSLTNWCYWDSNKELMHITLFGTRNIRTVIGFHSIV